MYLTLKETGTCDKLPIFHKLNRTITIKTTRMTLFKF
jgi:hypothetical protein